ncbi:MAG: flagellar hook-basal body complex protein FliE [Bdellovibrionaceae bacterium]|nr:flagellar hook-basal body complex protein FliE [Pseudobdellovibrionaceae bacterium]
MEGFTVRNADRFLQTGSFGDGQSMRIEGPSLSQGDRQTIQTDFAKTLKDAIVSVNELQKAADKAAQNLATGKTDNIAEVMIASEKADIALRLMVQVRNKIIDAYQEIMRIQV